MSNHMPMYKILHFTWSILEVSILLGSICSWEGELIRIRTEKLIGSCVDHYILNFPSRQCNISIWGGDCMLSWLSETYYILVNFMQSYV